MAASLGLAGRAEAHATGVSQSTFVVEGDAVRATIVLARADAEVALRGDVASDVDVEADGARCRGTYEGARDVGGDGVELRATFACGHPPRAVDVSLPLLDALPAPHAHLARVVAGGAAREATLRSGAQHVALVRDDVAPPSSFVAVVAQTLAVGALHVLRGWDHLLFLAALALGERRLRSLAVVATAFTVAHAITLGLAALGAIALSPRIVEPAIAASIALVGAENAIARRRVPRVATAFAFGLVHGLGFAASLRAVALATGRLAPALVGFNLGVELAQLAVVAAIAAILAAMRRHGRLSSRGERLASAAVGLTGGALFAARLCM